MLLLQNLCDTSPAMTISDILLQFSRENFYLGVCFGRSKTDV